VFLPERSQTMFIGLSPLTAHWSSAVSPFFTITEREVEEKYGEAGNGKHFAHFNYGRDSSGASAVQLTKLPQRLPLLKYSQFTFSWMTFPMPVPMPLLA